MDMSTGMESDSAVANLSLSDPKCVAAAEMCDAFYAAENASQAATPWAGQFEYGHWATFYYVCIIFLVMLCYGAQLWRDRRIKPGSPRSSRPSFGERAVAAGRYVTYRRVNIVPREWLDTPSFGILALFLASCIVLAALVFTARPNYHPHLRYGSPPIAIRSGLMAFACMPILVALAGKANVVTLLTGVSHEKLNIVHQFVAWASFVLSAIHTIPFFVASYRDEGAGGYARVKKEFYAGAPKMGANEYSGVPPFAILFALCVSSLPYIRHRFYESFYAAHILLGITYVGLLFWHAGNTEDSWAYLWATIALWLASWVARAFWFTRPLNVRGRWLRGSSTSITKLPGDMTRLEILAPEGFSYEPGQHCFLRFPAIAPFDNHPFTICTVPLQADRTGSRDRMESFDSPHVLTFLVRAHAGFTRKVTSYCSADCERTTNAWIDGPYGGIRRPLERLYDHLILVAGGSGISACLPWVLYFLGQDRQGIKTKKVTLMWVVRRSEHLKWAEKQLQVASNMGGDTVALETRFFVTDEADRAGKLGTKDALEKMPEVKVIASESTSADQTSGLMDVSYGRPAIANVMKDIISQPTTAVLGCGPSSMRKDLANVCAEMQSKIVKGEMKELVLYSEEFGW